MIAPYQLKYLELLSKNNNFFFLPHLIYSQSFKDTIEKKEKYSNELFSQYECDEIFFSSTRHEWYGKLKNRDDNKGNNIIIESFAKYLDLQKHKKTKLLIIEKGYDIEATKNLIAALNIQDRVIWLSEMPRPELEKYYLAAKFAFGQFHTPVITNSSLEPLAAATPVISFFGNTPISIAYYETLPPVYNSKTPHQIAHFLYNMHNEHDGYLKLQEKSLSWISTYCSKESFARQFKNSFK